MLLIIPKLSVVASPTNISESEKDFVNDAWASTVSVAELDWAVPPMYVSVVGSSVKLPGRFEVSWIETEHDLEVPKLAEDSKTVFEAIVAVPPQVEVASSSVIPAGMLSSKLISLATPVSS